MRFVRVVAASPEEALGSLRRRHLFVAVLMVFYCYFGGSNVTLLYEEALPRGPPAKHLVAYGNSCVWTWKGNLHTTAAKNSAQGRTREIPVHAKESHAFVLFIRSYSFLPASAPVPPAPSLFSILPGP